MQASQSESLLDFGLAQGCQIFLITTYQNGKNVPNNHKIYQMAVQYVDQMVIKYTTSSKLLQNLPKLFLIENMPSCNPGRKL
jgi:hypothetical protein